MVSQTELLARENDAEMARLTGIIFDLMKALKEIEGTAEGHQCRIKARAALAAVGNVGMKS